MCANQSIVANPNYNTWDSIRACTLHNILLTWTGGSFLDLTIFNETQIIVSPTNKKKKLKQKITNLKPSCTTVLNIWWQFSCNAKWVAEKQSNTKTGQIRIRNTDQQYTLRQKYTYKSQWLFLTKSGRLSLNLDRK